jgi:glyoxylase-like metal-dependent hydrolase (beta-lactamase superfamily II)
MPVALAQQPTFEPSISHVAGDLYRAVNNSHRTVFLVTSEGIIMTDPLNTKFATWLKAEMAERFDVPVRYVIHAHHHADHAAGGAVFADTAQIVGHENVAVHLESQKDSPRFADVVPPTMTYSDRMTITLGGQTVQLIHLVPSSGDDDGTFLLFPGLGVVFAVDFVSVRRLPFTRFGAEVDGWFAALDQLMEFDFDILVGGHGEVGGREDVIAYRGYLENLLAAVKKGIEDGRSADELKQSIRMEAYSEWDLYEAFREENIEKFYEYALGKT